MKLFTSFIFIFMVWMFTGFQFSEYHPSQKDNATPIVRISSGEISGNFEDGVHSFKGIPYAKADRFMPARDPEPWSTVRECKNFGPVARQIVPWYPESVQNEQDLFSVNVWTPGIQDGARRPVLVWLHGGGFHVGASNDPMTYGEALARKGDLVFVSVNHRLNILGFLDLSGVDEKYAHSANVGMLDIVKALEWVQENIEIFGGNPEDVTIVGESGGGGKVGTLMCMPSAKGLFHKAIIQSGTLLNRMTSEKSRTLGLTVLNNLGLKPKDVQALDTMDYHDLVKAGNDAIAELAGPRKPGSARMFGFAPSADGEVLVQQPFSPGFAEFSKDIPLMIGSTLNEMMPTAYGEKDLTEAQARERLNEEYGEATDRYIELFAQAYPDYTPQDLLSIDKIFRPYTIRTADARAAESDVPLYVYLLGWKSGVDNASRGSFHGLDIPLAFHTVDLRQDWTGNTDKAWAMSDKMSSAWINFVKTGNPNVEGELPPWEVYTPENGATMYFDDDCKIVNNHDRELMNLILSQTNTG